MDHLMNEMDHFRLHMHLMASKAKTREEAQAILERLRQVEELNDRFRDI